MLALCHRNPSPALPARCGSAPNASREGGVIMHLLRDLNRSTSIRTRLHELQQSSQRKRTQMIIDVRCRLTTKEGSDYFRTQTQKSGMFGRIEAFKDGTEEKFFE